MKNVNLIIKLFVAAALTLGTAACRDAAVELYDADLGKLLRPSELTASAAGYGSITVSWRGSASAFRLEYALSEDFSGEVSVVEAITGNRYAVAGLEEATSYYFRVRGLSDRPDVAASEYSAVATARTLTEPKIPNVQASSEMEYTLAPWSVTCTVTMTWGDAELEPEAVSSVRATPVEGGGALTFPVSEAEAAAQRVAFSEGILTDTHYTFELLVGEKMRGSVTHRTVPGPTPALYAAAQLDFTTDPVTATAEVRWELYYVAPDELSKVDFTRKGSEIPEQEVPVTPADIAAGCLTAANLTPGAVYVAELKAADGRTVASVEFPTPAAPSSDVIIARPGDDLAAIISDPDRTSDTVYLVAGEYALTDVNPTVTRNLVLTSDDPTRTVVHAGCAFRASGTFDRLVFRNIRFDCSTYLLQISNVDYDIGLYRIDNCIVDLNSGAAGNSTLFSTAGTASNCTLQILREYEVSNSLVFANRGQSQNIVYMMSSTSGIPQFGRLLLRNSTFANCARGLVANSGPGDNAFEVVIDNCTLYNVSSGGNYALVDIRNKGTEQASKRSVTLRNSVLWFGGSVYKVLQFAGSGEGQYVPKERIDCSNFYHFASQTPAFGSSAYNVADRMTAYSGTPADLWVNPMDDPSAAGASFRIKDHAVRSAQEAAGTVLGDPRWE